MAFFPSSSSLHAALAAVLCLALTGCATSPNPTPRDPFEPFNRGVYKFNDGLDKLVLKPVATGYTQAVPPLVRTGVGNFFRNLTEPWSFVNNVLQLQISDAGETFIRFTTNTVFGLGGLLDIAGEANIDQHKQDFGRTLAYYKVPTGPYLVLPFFGSSTVRDTAALPVDWKGDLVTGVNNVPSRNSLYALRLVDGRANLLRASAVLDEAALDKYSFTRDAYLQLRRNQPRDTTENDGDLNDSDAGSPGAGANPQSKVK